ncbi:MAG TPA: multiheme c-type cytochrome, partial [Stellaceae bacterium]
MTMITRGRHILALGSLLLLLALPTLPAGASSEESPRDIKYVTAPPAPVSQPQAQAFMKSAGCLTCHEKTDQPTMHANQGVILGCADCHGGDAQIVRPEAAHEGETAYRTAQDKAHVQPRYPGAWHYPASANPRDSYTLLNRESPEFIRFVNPSDYRIVRESCGACHLPVIQAAERSIMASGAMLWGGGAYNNGILPYKNYIVGEAYTREGEPAELVAPVKPTPEQTRSRGLLPALYPLPSWETVPPGDVFRVFERGGRNIITQFPEIGNPNSLGVITRLEEPGRPDLRQSNRGPATGLRVSIPILNITKSRLNDPLMWFLGTNDNPGDYRTSGCGACHIPYANDREVKHGGQWAKYGSRGTTQTVDATIPKDEPGHPIRHELTTAIPTSQCMICHMHQPNIFLNSMLGFTMSDYESDADKMFPAKQKYPTNAETVEALNRNPEGAVVRGNWSDVKFVEKVSELNPELKSTQFADYHGHGWNFRAVFKRDRKGNLLDQANNVVPPEDPEKFKKAVHLSSVHVDLGMQCVDCHFSQDEHGNGHIYGEVAAAVEIQCADCHGTATKYPTLRTSGPAARPGGNDLSLLRTADGRTRFEWRGQKLYQRSAVYPDLEWEVSLVKDTVTPGNPKYNEKAARAKLMSKGTSMAWGPGVPQDQLAHPSDEMACFTCHLSWTTSCAGCHLPIEANYKTERHHYEGGETRNFATSNPQVARDDMFQLGRHGTVRGNIIAPIRSTSALILSSTNINRERIYVQQPPVSASGYSSQAFAPHYPHTERRTETKTCTDCHLSQDNDNNAIMAQLLLHGTNFVNFVGYNAWIGQESGFQAVRVTEWDEPQAVVGSYLHKYAYPDYYKAHLDRGRQLDEAYGSGSGTVGCLQLRGEYLYVAQGSGGMEAYDVASVANKGISERIITAPFSPLGQDTHIRSKNATCVALPTNQPINPLRNQGDLMRVTNQEQAFHPIYNYAFITDAEEGLIVTNVDTLQDGEPRNNFLKRALTWNEGGILRGARHLTIAGYYFYVAADAGIVVLNMDDPMHPKVVTVIPMNDARATALQFRYLFALDRDGLHVVDVTNPAAPKVVPSAFVPFQDARRIYVARTYAYVAARREGVAIVDVEKPE